MAYAAHAFGLEQPGPDGCTKRAHLEQMWQMTGERPAELDGPPLPFGAATVWRWFVELASGRRSTGFGLSPLVWADIAAYFSLQGERPSSWELSALRALDSAFMRAAGEAVQAQRAAAAKR